MSHRHGGGVLSSGSVVSHRGVLCYRRCVVSIMSHGSGVMSIVSHRTSVVNHCCRCSVVSLNVVSHSDRSGVVSVVSHGAGVVGSSDGSGVSGIPQRCGVVSVVSHGAGVVATSDGGGVSGISQRCGVVSQRQVARVVSVAQACATLTQTQRQRRGVERLGLQYGHSVGHGHGHSHLVDDGHGDGLMHGHGDGHVMGHRDGVRHGHRDSTLDGHGNGCVDGHGLGNEHADWVGTVDRDGHGLGDGYADVPDNGNSNEVRDRHADLPVDEGVVGLGQDDTLAISVTTGVAQTGVGQSNTVEAQAVPGA